MKTDFGEIMGATISGKVVSANISEMSGFKFGIIIVETTSKARYKLKYDRHSTGEIPKVGSNVTVAIESGNVNRIVSIEPEVSSKPQVSEQTGASSESTKRTEEDQGPSMSDIFMAASADLVRRMGDPAEVESLPPEVRSALGGLTSGIRVDENTAELHRNLAASREEIQSDLKSRDLWERLLHQYQELRRPEAKEIDALLKNPQPSEEDYLILHAHLLIGGAEYDKAKTILNQLDENGCEDSRFLLLLGKMHIINGEYQYAQDILKKLVDVDCTNIETLSHLARVLVIQGKQSEALLQLNTILKIDSGHRNTIQLKYLVENYGAGTNISFGILGQKPGPGSTSQKSVDEIRFHFGLEMPLGSTVEDLLHVIFSMDYERGFKHKYHKSVLLMLFHDSNSMRFSCVGQERKITNGPFLFTEYKMVEPYSYKAEMFEPHSISLSLSDVIVPGSQVALFRTTFGMKAAVIMMQCRSLNNEIEEQLKRIVLTE